MYSNLSRVSSAKCLSWKNSCTTMCVFIACIFMLILSACSKNSPKFILMKSHGDNNAKRQNERNYIPSDLAE